MYLNKLRHGCANKYAYMGPVWQTAEKAVFFILALVLYIQSGTGIAQEINIDSVKKVLNAANHDTTRIKILNELANSAPDGEWEKYNEMCKKLLLSKKHVSNKKEKLFYAKMLASTYNNEGLMLAAEGKIDDAIGTYKKSLQLSLTQNDFRNSIITFLNIGRQYYNKGDIAESLHYFGNAFEQYESNNDTSSIESIAYAYNFVGQIYKDQNDSVQALKHYNKAMSLFKQQKNGEGIATSNAFIGAMYMDNGHTRLAKPFFEKALVYFEDQKIIRSIATMYNNLGRVFLDEKQTNKAIEYLKRSMLLFEKENYQVGLSSVFKNLGSAYMASGKLDSAQFYFEKSLRIAQELQYPANISYAAKGLYELYKLKGNEKKSLEMFELYVHTQDSLTSNQNKRTVLVNQLRFEYRQKQLKDSLTAIAKQQRIRAELVKTKTRLYGLVFGILFLILLGVFVMQRLRFKQKEKEFNLRNKIAGDLHDEVGSALSSISMYAGVARMQKQPETVNGLIEKIESTSRETLTSMGDIVWSLVTRNDKLMDVFERIKQFNEPLFKAKKIHVIFNLDKQAANVLLNMQQKRNVYLIYKEAVNNALKYAGPTQLNVDVEVKGRFLKMNISDNGCGFDAAQLVEGNGMLSMRERAKELNGTLAIESSKGKGTAITLLFKLV